VSAPTAGGIAHALAVARQASALGHVNLHAISSVSGSSKLQLEVTAQISPAVGAAAPVVMIEIFENGIVTKINGGENGGREIT
jgi:hypothetical protein